LKLLKLSCFICFYWLNDYHILLQDFNDSAENVLVKLFDFIV
jgi:hypothetical protein